MAEERGSRLLFQFKMKGKQEFNPLMGQRLALTLARLSRIHLLYIYKCFPDIRGFPLKSRSVEISRLVEARPFGVADLDAIVFRGLSGKPTRCGNGIELKCTFP